MRLRGGWAIYVNLPNEANFVEWVRLWIGLRDKWLRDQVGQIVTWLRLFRIGFVLAIVAAKAPWARLMQPVPHSACDKGTRQGQVNRPGKHAVIAPVLVAAGSGPSRGSGFVAGHGEEFLPHFGL
jgi:hypothetical protein